MIPFIYKFPVTTSVTDSQQTDCYFDVVQIKSKSNHFYLYSPLSQSSSQRANFVIGQTVKSMNTYSMHVEKVLMGLKRANKTQYTVHNLEFERNELTIFLLKVKRGFV